MHFGDGIDDGRSTHSLRSNRVTVAHNGAGRSKSGRIDRYLMDRTTGCPHSALDVSPLQGRSGGATGDPHSAGVPQNQFAVRSDVDNQRDGVAFKRAFGQNHPDGVAADKTRYHRKYMDIGGRIQIESDGFGFYVTAVA